MRRFLVPVILLLSVAFHRVNMALQFLIRSAAVYDGTFLSEVSFSIDSNCLCYTRSPHVRESGHFFLWNPELWALESGIHLKKSRSHWQRLRNPWRKIQNPRLTWFPYVKRTKASIEIWMLNGKTVNGQQRFFLHWKRVINPKRLCFFKKNIWHFLDISLPNITSSSIEIA